MFEDLFRWKADEDYFDKDEEEQPVAVFQFESGTLCATCGLYHADQWQCDDRIPNPWGSTDEE